MGFVGCLDPRLGSCQRYFAVCGRAGCSYPPPTATETWRPGPSGISTPDNTVAFVIFDSNYKAMFFCWLRWYLASKPRLKALDVVALDNETIDVMRKWNEEHPGLVRKILPGLQLVHKHYATGPRRLWPSNLYQHAIWSSILELMKDGEHIFHLDTDAFVFFDPWGLFQTRTMLEADVVGTCDCFGPGCQEWGCSLNPGVMFFKNTEATKAVIRGILKIWEEGRAPKDEHQMSDMFMLNRYILDQGNCTFNGNFRNATCPGLAFKWALFVHGVVARGHTCGDPLAPGLLERCRREKISIAHGRNGMEVKLCISPPPLPGEPAGAEPTTPPRALGL